MKKCHNMKLGGEHRCRNRENAEKYIKCPRRESYVRTVGFPESGQNNYTSYLQLSKKETGG